MPKNPKQLTEFDLPEAELDLTFIRDVKFVKKTWKEWCLGEVAKGATGGHQARQIIYETTKEGARTGRIALGRA